MTELDRCFLDNKEELWAITITSVILLTIYGEDGIIKKIFDLQGKEI